MHFASGNSRAAEHLSHHRKVEGLNPAPAIDIIGENMAKVSRTLVEQYPHHPQVNGLSPATALWSMGEKKQMKVSQW